MENKSHAFAAGAFVLALVAALVAVIVWFTRDTTVRHVYELSTRDPVSGLQPQAAVRYRGIAVGRVTHIDFDPTQRGNVRVRLLVDEAVPLTRSTYATLSYQGVTGLAFIALDDKGESQEALRPNDAEPPRIPLRPSILAQLQDRGETILEQVQTLGTRVNTLLSDDNQVRIATALENIAQTSAAAHQLTRRLDHTLEHSLAPALAAMPQLAGQTREALEGVKTAAANVSRVANNFNGTVNRLNAPGGVLDQLNSGTQALGQGMEGLTVSTLPRLNRVVDDASLTLRRLGQVAETINEHPQSLLVGTGAVQPGPGEDGFEPPTQP